MKRTIPLLAAAGATIAAIGVIRTRVPADVPGWVTHRFNPLVMRFGLAGGRRSPWAILEHRGRLSGTTYRTPISILEGSSDDHVYVRLTYGSDVHWVRNVRATGHCRVQAHATILELDEPTVVTASENVLIPAPIRTVLDLAGRTYLRLHIVARRPGTFADSPDRSDRAPATGPAAPPRVFGQVDLPKSA